MFTQFPTPFLNLREDRVVRTLACGVVMLVFAGGLGVVDADEPTPGSSPEQQAAPQEQAAAQQPAATQPTIARFGPNLPSRRAV